MIILGIDPGIAITGCALIKEEKGTLTLVHQQAITTPSRSKLPDRLTTLFIAIATLLKSYHPDVTAIESLFFNTNAKTALIIGQARGVIQLAVNQKRITIAEYTPLQVKIAISGYGRAEKRQMQKMVKQILKAPTLLTPDDVADAAAVAITHALSYRMKHPQPATGKSFT